jgi:hypothetical protein
MSATDRIAAGAALPVGLASRVDRAFGLGLEIATALLVVAEIVILFIGIVARYAFNRPLIWSDELASLLFLWLAMLGTVLALRRGEHMRMTAPTVFRCELGTSSSCWHWRRRWSSLGPFCCRRSTMPRAKRSLLCCRWVFR